MWQHLLCTNSTKFSQNHLPSFREETCCLTYRQTDRQAVIIFPCYVYCMYLYIKYVKLKIIFQQRVQYSYDYCKDIRLLWRGEALDFNLVTSNFFQRWITIHPIWPQPKHRIHCACGGLERCRVQWLHKQDLILNWQDPCWHCHWVYQHCNFYLRQIISAHSNHCCP